MKFGTDRAAEKAGWEMTHGLVHALKGMYFEHIVLALRDDAQRRGKPLDAESLLTGAMADKIAVASGMNKGFYRERALVLGFIHGTLPQDSDAHDEARKLTLLADLMPQGGMPVPVQRVLVNGNGPIPGVRTAERPTKLEFC